jgi:hypothetical protein
MRDMPGRQCMCSNLHVKFAAAPGDDSLILKPQLQTAERDFEPGRAFIISNEEIRYAQCKQIERAAGRNTKLAKARAAQILHRR